MRKWKTEENEGREEEKEDKGLTLQLIHKKKVIKKESEKGINHVFLK